MPESAIWYCGQVTRFERAVAALYAVHNEDPRRVPGDIPLSVRYHDHLGGWVERLDSGAPDEVRLAARCQHIERWLLPRSEYPQGRVGYRSWRVKLAQMHAQRAQTILADVGYGPETTARVGDLLLKKYLGRDPHAQLLEDAVCLTFIELEFVDFARKHVASPGGAGVPKVVSIVRKTWGKMSERGHVEAHALLARLQEVPGAPAELGLIAQALQRGAD